MIIHRILPLFFMALPFTVEAANINAFGGDFKIPASCVFRVHHAIHNEPTFFCENAFVSFTSRKKLDIERFSTEDSVISRKQRKHKNLEIFHFVTKHGEQKHNIVHFGFICNRNDCITVSG